MTKEEIRLAMGGECLAVQWPSRAMVTWYEYVIEPATGRVVRCRIVGWSLTKEERGYEDCQEMGSRYKGSV
jgi:hypothetical protein